MIWFDFWRRKAYIKKALSIMHNNKPRRGHNRGGVMLLIECALIQCVTKVDMDADNIISLCKSVKFGGSGIEHYHAG